MKPVCLVEKVALVTVLLLTACTSTPETEVTEKAEIKKPDSTLVSGIPSGTLGQDADTAPTLIEAAAAGDIEQVKLLISQGAEVDAKDSSGRTALHFAAENGRTEVAELLLENGADVNAKYLSRTPLHGAAGGGQSGGFEGPIEMVELLIEKGADINAKNNLGVTPLQMAARNGRKDIVELLIAKGADINATNNRGISALDIAKRTGPTEIIELLNEHRAAE